MPSALDVLAIIVHGKYFLGDNGKASYVDMQFFNFVVIALKMHGISIVAVYRVCLRNSRGQTPPVKFQA